MKFLRTLFLKIGFLLFLSSVTSVFAQDANQQFRQVQEFLRAGQLQEAKNILELLEAANPQNIVFYNQLLDLLLSMKDWDGALTLVRERLAKSPADVGLSIDEARVLYRMGKQDEAVSKWRQILKSHPGQQGLVQQVAGAMMAERNYDEAIRVYLEGRKASKKPDQYAMNLAGLYAATIQYGKAAGEYLNYLKTHPEQIGYVESQIIRFPKTEESVRDIEAAFRDAGEDVLTLRIFTRFYLEAGLYDKAYETVKKQDALAPEKQRGVALQQFAILAQRAGAARPSAAAYQDLLTRYPTYPASDAVWMGLGAAYESQSDFQQALSAYETVTSRFPKSPAAPQALSRKGILLRDYVYDLPAAREALQTLIQKYPRSPEVAQARLDLAECDALAGDLPSARAIYKKIVDAVSSDPSPLEIHARARLAEIDYWRGDFDAALETLSPFSGAGLGAPVLEHPDLNDALQLRHLIQANKTKDPEALRLYAIAQNFQNQRKDAEAILRLDTLIVRYPDRPLVAEARFLRADLFRSQNHVQSAVADLDTFLSKFPDHLLADRALFTSAQILEASGKPREAAARYERLLSDYPFSLLADEARERIRALEKGRA